MTTLEQAARELADAVEFFISIYQLYPHYYPKVGVAAERLDNAIAAYRAAEREQEAGSE